ncbi:hypothetical protein [Candidatus Nitrospira bockiana]
MALIETATWILLGGLLGWPLLYALATLSGMRHRTLTPLEEALERKLSCAHTGHRADD